MTVAEKHGIPHVRPAAGGQARLVAVARPMREKAHELIELIASKTPSPETAIVDLSGGNVQRAVLARELSGDVDRADRRQPVLRPRFRVGRRDSRADHGAAQSRRAVLAGSEDLDEILELADRVAVMSSGTINYQAPWPKRIAPPSASTWPDTERQSLR